MQRLRYSMCVLAATTLFAQQFTLRDTEGRLHDRGEWSHYAAIVVYFAMTDCPISNSYVPELNRIHNAYAERGVLFLAVATDLDSSAVAVRLSDPTDRSAGFLAPVQYNLDRGGLSRSDSRLTYFGLVQASDVAAESPSSRRQGSRAANSGPRRTTSSAMSTAGAVPGPVCSSHCAPNGGASTCNGSPSSSTARCASSSSAFCIETSRPHSNRTMSARTRCPSPGNETRTRHGAVFIGHILGTAMTSPRPIIAISVV